MFPDDIGEVIHTTRSLSWFPLHLLIHIGALGIVSDGAALFLAYVSQYRR